MRRQWRRMMIITEWYDNEALRMGAKQRVKGCFVLLLWSAKHFTFSQKGHDSTRRECESSQCVCYYAKHRAVSENGVWVCACSAQCVKFPPAFSGVVSPGLDSKCVFNAYLPYFVRFFCYLLALGVSRCFMRACVCVCVCTECIWVFIGSQWVEQSSWPHFLLLLTERHSGLRLQRTRHCLEELPVTAAYNHLICHCFDCIFLALFWHSSTLIQFFWTTRSGPDIKEEPQTWEGRPDNSCCHEK